MVLNIGKGWRGESHRHSLARKGIKTGSKEQRYESCVKKLKVKENDVNPYAVCRKSVYGNRKEKLEKKHSKLRNNYSMVDKRSGRVIASGLSSVEKNKLVKTVDLKHVKFIKE